MYAVMGRDYEALRAAFLEFLTSTDSIADFRAPASSPHPDQGPGRPNPNRVQDPRVQQGFVRGDLVHAGSQLGNGLRPDETEALLLPCGRV